MDKYDLSSDLPGSSQKGYLSVLEYQGKKTFKKSLTMSMWKIFLKILVLLKKA